MPRSLDRRPASPREAAPLIALVTDDIDWHARTLSKAFAATGARTASVDLAACRLETSHPAGIHIPGLGRVPDAVFVRTMSGGTFQQVTMRLGILHALREIGVTVWNDARTIERCVDKSATSFLLAQAGIPTPETWTTESAQAARAIVQHQAGSSPLVLKPLFGSQGRGLRLIHTAEGLPGPDEVAGVYYLQRFVAVERDGFRDFRLLVSGGRVIAAMMRHAPTWITNVKRGGRPIAVVADPQMKDLAVRAATVVGANFAGIDILYDAEGHPTVLEVNSMPAWTGLQKVTQAEVASLLAGDLLAALPAARREATA
jgi:RimK family alpha-L-glutamate ligase